MLEKSCLWQKRPEKYEKILIFWRKALLKVSLMKAYFLKEKNTSSKAIGGAGS